MANYDKPLILTVGSKGLLSTGLPTTATAFGLATTDDYVLGTSGNDIITGGVAAWVFTGTDGNGLDGADTLEGGAGDDQYIVNDQGDVIVEQVGEGSNDTVFTAVSYTLPLNVENIIVKQDNAVAITVTGNKGDNILDGSLTTSKSDSLVGLEGNDIYIVSGDATSSTTILATQDKVFETKPGTGGGIDTIVGLLDSDIDLSKDSKQIVGAANIENVVLGDSAVATNVTGNTLNNRLTGNASINTLIGNAGNDTLDGGDDSAALAADKVDRLDGGIGDDTYIVRNSSDVIVENSNAGKDTVRSSADYDISGSTTITGQNIENIVLLGSGNTKATGNAQPNNLTGGSGDNSLIGGTNNDTLNGNQGNDTLDGGVGTDSLTGGKGNDTYVVDTATDKVIETSDDSAADQGGVDTIVSAVTYTLPVNVEKLTLGTWTAGAADSSGTTAMNATGNTLNNTIIGNAGNNIINGGAGDDSMNGGNGNDTYYMDSTDDTVVAGTGTDTLYSSVSVAVGDGTTAAFQTKGVEIVKLTGTDAINGVADDISTGVALTGNDVDNNLSGGTGTDTIHGDTTTTGTKGGVDTITGGGGNDTIYGDGGDDSLDGQGGADSVYGGEGNDTINDTDGTAAADGMFGNNGDDTINSSTGADTVDGSDGNDTISASTNATAVSLIGGTGNDIITGGTSTTTAIYAGNTKNVTTLLPNSDPAATTTKGGYTDTIDGGTGNDSIAGGAGQDGILGGDGNDTITGGTGKDTVLTGNGNDKVVFTMTNSTTSADTTSVSWATSAANADIDLYPDLALKAGSGDTISLALTNSDITVANIGATVSGSFSITTGVAFVTSLDSLLSASGVGFDTSKAGDVSAAVVVNGTSSQYLAVDLNGDNHFTNADFVIEITGSSYAGITTATFV